MDTVIEKVKEIQDAPIKGRRNELIKEFLSWEKKINDFNTETKRKGYDLPLVDTIGKSMFQNLEKDS